MEGVLPAGSLRPGRVGPPPLAACIGLTRLIPAKVAAPIAASARRRCRAQPGGPLFAARAPGRLPRARSGAPGATRLSARPVLPTLLPENAQAVWLAEEPTLLSPCIKVCAIDATSGLCAGCARTRAEIAAWSAMSDAERDRIMTQLAARRRRAGLQRDG